MSRWFLDDSSNPHGADSAEAVDDNGTTGSGGSRRDTTGTARPRLRDDPAGRRSLTGVEFRRQRSRG
jgi:hypothetical protein